MKDMKYCARHVKGYCIDTTELNIRKSQTAGRVAACGTYNKCVQHEYKLGERLKYKNI